MGIDKITDDSKTFGAEPDKIFLAMIYADINECEKAQDYKNFHRIKKQVELRVLYRLTEGEESRLFRVFNELERKVNENKKKQVESPGREKNISCAYCHKKTNNPFISPQGNHYCSEDCYKMFLEP